MRLFENEIDGEIWTEEEIIKNIGKMQNDKDITIDELLELIENHDFLNSGYSFIEIESEME